MFTEIVTPRFGDVDGLGHINNTVIPVWFELARNPIFRFFTPDLSLKLGEWKLIMARVEFDFLAELFYGSDVEIRTYIIKIGNSSFTMAHEAWQNGRLAVKGKAVTVHYDFVNKKAAAIPADIKSRLSEHLVEDYR